MTTTAMTKNTTITMCRATRLELIMSRLTRFSRLLWFDSRSRRKAARRALVCQGYASPTRGNARENLRLRLRGTPVGVEASVPELVRGLKTATVSAVGDGRADS